MLCGADAGRGLALRLMAVHEAQTCRCWGWIPLSTPQTLSQMGKALIKRGKDDSRCVYERLRAAERGGAGGPLGWEPQGRRFYEQEEPGHQLCWRTQLVTFSQIPTPRPRSVGWLWRQTEKSARVHGATSLSPRPVCPGRGEPGDRRVGVEESCQTRRPGTTWRARGTRAGILLVASRTTAQKARRRGHPEGQRFQAWGYSNVVDGWSEPESCFLFVFVWGFVILIY